MRWILLCRESHQTTRHIVEECPLIPWRPATSTRSGSRRVPTHSLEACDIYTKRVPTSAHSFPGGLRRLHEAGPDECPLIPWRPATSTRSGSRRVPTHSLEACDIYTKRVPTSAHSFPGGLRHLHEAGPDECPLIPWRPATSTRSGSRRVPTHSLEACDIYTKRVPTSAHSFPGGLRHLHEAGPDAVEWLSKLSMKLRVR